MQVIKIFQGEDSENSDLLRPWDQADFEGWLSLLTWKVALSLCAHACASGHGGICKILILSFLPFQFQHDRAWETGKPYGSDDTSA